jgi:hypothetical protein
MIAVHVHFHFGGSSHMVNLDGTTLLDLESEIETGRGNVLQVRGEQTEDARRMPGRSMIHLILVCSK